MQQIMETMHALQEKVVTSRVDQKHFQVDLAAPQANNEELRTTNEELRRSLQQAKERAVDERAHPYHLGHAPYRSLRRSWMLCYQPRPWAQKSPSQV